MSLFHMQLTVVELQEKVAQLESENACYKNEISSYKNQLTNFKEEVKWLKEKLDALLRRLFGRKSEKLPEGQAWLFAELDPDAQPRTQEAAQAPQNESAPLLKKPTKARRTRLPEDLPVVERTIEPAEVLAEPAAWRRIGEEVSEQLDYSPGRYTRLRTIRPKYTRRKALEPATPAPITIAALPPRIIEGGLPTENTLTHVLISKYCDHLPFYRQEKILAQRHGITLPRQTLSRWAEQVSWWLVPLYDHLKSQLLSTDYLQVDETPIKYLAPGTGKAQQGYFWTYHAPKLGTTLYDWHPSRAAECAAAFLGKKYTGLLHTDGYSAYAAIARANPHLTHLGCWAHTRRKFIEAQASAPSSTAIILRHIGALYGWEKQLRQNRAGPRLRAARRASSHKMVAQRLHKILQKLAPRHRPQSQMGRAIAYALDQWPRLQGVFEHGQAELDTNLVENTIRPTAIGKKNWLFVGAKDAGQTSAIIYSIIQSARHHDLDPYDYLLHLLTQLPLITTSQLPTLTPAIYAKTKNSKSTPPPTPRQ